MSAAGDAALRLVCMGHHWHHRSRAQLCTHSLWLQVDKNVEREILNHRMLLNANVVSFKEVCVSGTSCHAMLQKWCQCVCGRCWSSRAA